ncbi:LAFE_0F07096g1_1 [Lachancea fermentati]|uniref:DASH complex subunit ASK1 n=1 Tax=Lachancea fermentati TaxID=4955 RepID=A0A1G4MF44_LACFM|nr:LAFE_0F07096g1_1 [Lachancea fermentati]
MAEESLERLDQEITLHLQQIDSNLSYCFSKITQDIIPHVTKYGAVCDEVMDSCNWLKVMFQQAGNLQIDSVARPGSPEDQQALESHVSEGSLQTLFPGKPRVSADSSSVMAPPVLQKPTLSADTGDITTTTGQVLQLPDSSDEERADDEHTNDTVKSSIGDDADGSTMQRQRRKRKMSLLLQQQFGSSSSSAVPSPAQLTAPPPDSNLDSSPLRKTDVGQSESTKKLAAPPGTVIHFSTRQMTQDSLDE